MEIYQANGSCEAYENIWKKRHMDRQKDRQIDRVSEGERGKGRFKEIEKGTETIRPTSYGRGEHTEDLE